MSFGAVATAAAGALAAGAVNAAMSDDGSPAGGGGGGGQGFQTGFLKGYDDEYAYEQQRWQDQFNKALQQVQSTAPGQRDKTLELLQGILNQGKPIYAKSKLDTDYQDSISNISGELQGMLDRSSPEYLKRVNEAETGINRDYAESLQQMLDANAHRIAAGGVGTFNPERMDETIARTLAAKKDVAGQEAHGQVTNDLAKVITGQTNLLPSQSAAASGDRARQVAGLNFAGSNVGQQLATTNSYENQLSDLINKFNAAQPDLYDIKNKYRYQSSGVAGVQQANPTQDAIGQILSGLAGKAAGSGVDYIASLFGGGNIGGSNADVPLNGGYTGQGATPYYGTYSGGEGSNGFFGGNTSGGWDYGNY